MIIKNSYFDIMLFQSEYFIAHEDSDQLEVIEEFMYNDIYKSMVIIDSSLAIENIKELRGDYNCIVVFLNSESNPELETRKIIYIHDKIDEMAQAFILKTHSLLAFF